MKSWKQLRESLLEAPADPLKQRQTSLVVCKFILAMCGPVANGREELKSILRQSLDGLTSSKKALTGAMITELESNIPSEDDESWDDSDPYFENAGSAISAVARYGAQDPRRTLKICVEDFVEALDTAGQELNSAGDKFLPDETVLTTNEIRRAIDSVFEAIEKLSSDIDAAYGIAEGAGRSLGLSLARG